MIGEIFGFANKGQEFQAVDDLPNAHPLLVGVDYSTKVLSNSLKIVYFSFQSDKIDVR